MTIEIPFEITHLGGENNIHIVINACLEDIPVRLVVDTGASHSCLCKKTFKSIGQKSHAIKADTVMGIGKRKLYNQFMSIPRFELGGLTIEDYPFLMIPLAHINKMLKLMDLQPIHGLLGGDILFKYNAVVDYKERKITLSA